MGAGIGEAMPHYLWVEVIGTAVCHHCKIIACHMMVSLVEMLALYFLLIKLMSHLFVDEGARNNFGHCPIERLPGKHIIMLPKL